ncbi:hypothetical protein HPB49_011536 [Dermacentor silvarum]|uniref:Uncharacterized protein n=1 Tax=Dermacentor silvarum TaxID=543639 RepID=A0ACB8DZL7_DERSI|nr:hypothetical protein HPB49_011536 [Dermacentor silvarum]
MSLLQPPEFLPAPGKPAISWKQWRKLFENYLLASGNKPTVLLAAKRVCCNVWAWKSSALTGKEQDAGTAQNTTGEQNEFNIALAKLEDYFVATSNVVIERQQFCQRAQLPGESLDSFVTCLRELSVTCDLGTQLEEFIRDQLVEETGNASYESDYY